MLGSESLLLSGGVDVLGFLETLSRVSVIFLEADEMMLAMLAM